MVWCTSLQHAKHGPPEQDERPVFFNSPSTSQSYHTHQHLHQWVNPLCPDTRGTRPKIERKMERKRMGDLMDTIWSLLERDKELQELGILTSLSMQFLISQLETLWRPERRQIVEEHHWIYCWFFNYGHNYVPVGWFLLKWTNFIFSFLIYDGHFKNYAFIFYLCCLL